MDKLDFEWSAEDDEFRSSWDAIGGSVSLSVPASDTELSAEARADLLERALHAFPTLLGRDVSFRRSAYQQVSSEIDADDWPSFEVFADSFSLSEASLVDGANGNMFYVGSGPFAGYALTVFCDGLEFAEAALERTGQVPRA